jgi:hypothetical protein
MENKHNFKKGDIICVRNFADEDFCFRVFSHFYGKTCYTFLDGRTRGSVAGWSQYKPFEEPATEPQEAPEPDTTPFYEVGQEVECLVHGKGQVDVILDTNEFVVRVYFNDGNVCWYTYDGRLYRSKTQTLYPKGQCPTLPPIERPEPKKPDFPQSIEDLPNGVYHELYANGQIQTTSDKAIASPKYLPTREAAVSQRAANQLACLIWHINGGETPENGWMPGSRLCPKELSTLNWNTNVPHFLRFKNQDDAEKSAKVHRSLWIQYYTGKE